MKTRIFLIAAALLLLAGCGASGGTAQGSGNTDLESIAAYPETLNLSQGGRETVQVVLTPSDAEKQDLIWASSNRAVATVDESGAVTGVASGKTTLTATVDGQTLHCTIRVR